jgi:6-phosphogluconolactonase
MKEITIDVLPDAEAVAHRAAEYVARAARDAVADHGRFTFAVSGGRTPWAMFSDLAEEEVPWKSCQIYQADERVAPYGDPDRNLTHLLASLPPEGDAEVHAMPCEEPDIESAAERYAESLPEMFDLVHLGLGPDGHTASLVPGDPVLDITDHAVGVTSEYQGRRRMTLTYEGIARAREVLFLVTGADKVDALRKLRSGDTSIPAARIEVDAIHIIADKAAAPNG